ncbi:hypothetical protein PUN28_004001 [Cardiocondyla obscurior]|uniref:Secreted protein n=1 Tax=Cardiocondyla obscurior TaxID=286306 RepID=A0AAW2GNL0_9HYME
MKSSDFFILNFLHLNLCYFRSRSHTNFLILFTRKDEIKKLLHYFLRASANASVCVGCAPRKSWLKERKLKGSYFP